MSQMFDNQQWLSNDACCPNMPLITKSCSFSVLGPAGTMGIYDTLHFDYVFPEGCTRLSVRPINDGRCSPRRALQIIPPFA